MVKIIAAIERKTFFMALFFAKLQKIHKVYKVGKSENYYLYFCERKIINDNIKIMSFLTILSIAVALSMDSFSVSICKGLITKKFSFKTAILCGLWFGGFQALMPVIGYFLGVQFENLITSVDHWIAFGLLFLIGANMIREAFGEENNENTSKNDVKTMFLLAIATSIDALAIGITFAFLQVTIWNPIIIIGVTTFIFSFAGVAIGNFFGSRYSKPASIIGGIILVLIGTKILLEHLGVI